MFAYCGNNPVNRFDPNGCFWLAFGSAVLGAAVNVPISYFSSKITNQNYSFLDAAADVISGAAVAIPVVGPFVSGVINGGYTTYKNYESGASFSGAVFSGFMSGVLTIASISNLAELGDSVSEVLVSVASDLTFGTGYSLISSAVSKAVTSVDNTPISYGSAQVGTAPALHRGSYKCVRQIY